MTTTLETLAIRQRDQDADNWQRYTQLLRALADDQDYDIDDAARLLAAVGKSESDVRQDLATLNRRAEHRRQLDRAPAAAKRLREVERALAEHQAAFEAARQKFEQASRSLYEERDQLNQVLFTARASERQLRSTVLDQSLAARTARLAEQQIEVGKRLRDLERSLRASEFSSPAHALEKAKQAVEQLTTMLQQAKSDGRHAAAKEAERELEFAQRNLTEQQRVVASLRDAKREADAEAEKLERESVALRAEELVP